MEIKPQDLRVGNLVIANGLHEGKIMTVEGIDRQGTMSPESRVILFKEHHVGEFIKDIKGIELTPEWLERLGGKYSKYQGDENLTEEWSFGNGLISIVRWNFEDLWLSNSFSFKLRVKVTTVHHLQNLYFALTGEELAIDKTSLI